MFEVFVVETIKAINGKSDELRQALLHIVPLSRKEAACVQYDLFESNDTFLVIMRFKSAQDLDNHESSDHVQDFVRKYNGILYGEVTLSTWQSVNEMRPLK